jgi:2-polyprenyl-3-methyl-5-hydroxy-6-metoxy-1,4-benzoquinol methylase
VIASLHAILPDTLSRVNFHKAVGTVCRVYGRTPALLGGLCCAASKWAGIRRYYQSRLAEIYKLSVLPGMRILELGCGDGDLLARLEPAYGSGIDLSTQLIDKARSKYPRLHFETADASDLQLEGEFDFIICSDLLNDLWDAQSVFEQIAGHCHPATRILMKLP